MPLTVVNDSRSVASMSTPMTSLARGRPFRRPRNLHSAQPKSTTFRITLTCLGSPRMAKTRSYLQEGCFGLLQSEIYFLKLNLTKISWIRISRQISGSDMEDRGLKFRDTERPIQSPLVCRRDRTRILQG